MTWDYKVETLTNSRAPQRLSQLGRNGWELVAKEGSFYYFKRPSDHYHTTGQFDAAMRTFATELGFQAALQSLGYTGTLTDSSEY